MAWYDKGSTNTVGTDQGVPTLYNSANPSHVVYARHTDRTVVIYCDGHAKAIKIDKSPGSLLEPSLKDASVLRNFIVEDD